MNNRRLAILLPVILVLTACTQSEDINSIVEIPVTPAQEAASYQKGYLFVKFSEGTVVQDETPLTKSEAGRHTLEELGAYSVERVIPDAGEWEPRHRAAGLDRWYRVRYDASVPRTKAEAAVASLPGVDIVESLPRKKLHEFNHFNDPYQRYQWHYFNDGTLQSRGFKQGIDINVVPVWEKYTTGSKDVIVAVIDGGVDMTHPDLGDRVIPVGPGGSRNFVDGYEDYDVRPHGHGTHVAGTIAAVNNNGRGVVGIAGGDDGTGGVQILSCQIFVSRGEETDSDGDTEKSLVWAADHGAVICNNSWGYEYENIQKARSDRLPAFAKECIDYFVRNAGLDVTGTMQTGPMAGGVVFFSAGNENWAYGLPASYENVVAVSAVGPDGKRASYSNYGNWVDIAAPGGDDVPGANPHYGYILSLIPGSSYGWMAGTSMACPHVTGVAALLVSYFGGPGFTRENLLEKLLYGANYDATYQSDYPIGPLVDAYGAFLFDPQNQTPHITPVFPEDLRISEGEIRMPSHLSTSFDVLISGNSTLKYKIEVDPGSEAASYDVTPGGNLIFRIDALKAEPGRYTAEIRAGFAEDCMGTSRFTYEILPNHAPTNLAPIDYRIVEKKSSIGTVVVDLTDHIADEDGENLTYTCTFADAIAAVDVAGSSITIRATALGRTLATLTATDARGESCTQTFELYVCDANMAPTTAPNPVQDYLSVSKGAWHELSVSIATVSGKVIYDDVVAGDMVYPAQVDMRSFAPGRYLITVSLDKKSYTSVITKK